MLIEIKLSQGPRIHLETLEKKTYYFQILTTALLEAYSSSLHLQIGRIYKKMNRHILSHQCRFDHDI